MLESRHGRGVFVAKRRQVYSPGERKRRLDQALDVFLSEILTLGYTPPQIEDAVTKRLAKMTANQNKAEV